MNACSSVRGFCSKWSPYIGAGVVGALASMSGSLLVRLTSSPASTSLLPETLPNEGEIADSGYSTMSIAAVAVPVLFGIGVMAKMGWNKWRPAQAAPADGRGGGAAAAAAAPQKDPIPEVRDAHLVPVESLRVDLGRLAEIRRVLIQAEGASQPSGCWERLCGPGTRQIPLDIEQGAIQLKAMEQMVNMRAMIAKQAPLSRERLRMLEEEIDKEDQRSKLLRRMEGLIQVVHPRLGTVTHLSSAGFIAAMNAIGEDQLPSRLVDFGRDKGPPRQRRQREEQVEGAQPPRDEIDRLLDSPSSPEEEAEDAHTYDLFDSTSRRAPRQRPAQRQQRPRDPARARAQSTERPATGSGPLVRKMTLTDFERALRHAIGYIETRDGRTIVSHSNALEVLTQFAKTHKAQIDEDTRFRDMVRHYREKVR